MKIRTAREAGFTLVEIMIVVAIIGLLAAIAVPSFIRARDTSQRNACINNLKQIDGAAQLWALENRKLATSTYALDDVKPYLRLTSSNSLPGCPANGTYSPGTNVTDAPTCTVAGHALPNSLATTPGAMVP
jgi:prepilin-type N-terminal cleavage/methylation domain-containing protein